MAFEAKWETHIQKVSASLRLYGFSVTPSEVDEVLALKSTFADSQNVLGTLSHQGTAKKAFVTWVYDTDLEVASLDVNEHIRYLLRKFLPLKNKIKELGSETTIVAQIHWVSKAAAEGMGPIIDQDCVEGLGQLGACILFEGVQAE